MGLTITQEIDLRNKAGALAEQLRPLLALMSDSDRFMLFHSIVGDYCYTCGCDNNTTACGCQWN